MSSSCPNVEPVYNIGGGQSVPDAMSPAVRKIIIPVSKPAYDIAGSPLLLSIQGLSYCTPQVAVVKL